MHIKHATVRLGLLVGALSTVAAFAAAAPADGAAINHSDSIITSGPASPPAVAPGKAGGGQLGNAGGDRDLAQLDAAAEDSYPPVCNCFEIWLTGEPDQYMAPACTSQTIYLTKGEYEWDTILYNDDSGVVLDTNHYIPLDSSNYSWGDCIIPEKGYYIQSSELCPLNLPSGYPCVNLTEDQLYVTSDQWTVGSYLDWQSL